MHSEHRTIVNQTDYDRMLQDGTWTKEEIDERVIVLEQHNPDAEYVTMDEKAAVNPPPKEPYRANRAARRKQEQALRRVQRKYNHR